MNEAFENITALLCLDGRLPELEVFKNLNDLPIIAADGAGHRSVEMGIKVDTIVGDLDSSDLEMIPKTTEVIIREDQNFTDYEKSLDLIVERDLFPLMVFGATGLEMDHALYNLYITKRFTQKGTIFLHNGEVENQYSTFLYNPTTLRLPPQSNLSLLPFPETTVSTKGLRWNLNEERLSLDGKSSIRNIVEETEVQIDITNGCAMLTFERGRDAIPSL